MDIPNLRRQADSDNAVAQSILGNRYLDGVEVGVDDEEAFRLLSSAAGQGASRAKANLARRHAEGLGVPNNLPEAIRPYEAAAKAGRVLCSGRACPDSFARVGRASRLWLGP
jgi:TPR repeat protein